MKRQNKSFLLLIALIPLFFLGACREDRIRSKYSGA